MDSTMMLACETPTLPTIVAVEESTKENAPESAALEASLVAFATVPSTTEYSTELPACQIATAPTLEEIEHEIATAAQERIGTALRDLNETRARIERERNARDAALQAAQERASKTRVELDGLAGERTEMERRAQTFLVGDALKATIEKIHPAFNVRQLELEDALALAEGDAQEMQTQIQAALISDALELQLAEQYLTQQLETAAPDVATYVRLAATAEENLAAALQAVKDGLLHDAEVLLEKAKAGNADQGKLPKQRRSSLKQSKRRSRVILSRASTLSGMNPVQSAASGDSSKKQKPRAWQTWLRLMLTVPSKRRAMQRMHDSPKHDRLPTIWPVKVPSRLLVMAALRHGGRLRGTVTAPSGRWIA